MTQRVLLSWSSGKDSAWSLYMLRQNPDVEVIGLLTTVNTTYERVAMHSTRLTLAEAQARVAGLPLRVISLPWPCSNEVYEREMHGAIKDGVDSGATHIAFGDLFLEDIRAYRVKQLKGSGLQPLFPIWHEPTGPLARRMIDAGVVAVVTCVDLKKLSRSFAGRTFDHAFLDKLPQGVDPCGENGEFHTCVLTGPMFREPLGAVVGEIVQRDGFCFADLIPDGAIVGTQAAANNSFQRTLTRCAGSRRLTQTLERSPVTSIVKIEQLAIHPEALPQLRGWFEAEWPSYYGAEGPGDAQRDLQSFANRDRLPVGVVAFQDGALCGIAALKADSIASHSHLSPWAAAGLVKPSERGKGIGAQLIGALEQEARNLGFRYIYCGTSTANSLLERCGWQLIEHIIHERQGLGIYRKAF